MFKNNKKLFLIWWGITLALAAVAIIIGCNGVPMGGMLLAIVATGTFIYPLCKAFDEKLEAEKKAKAEALKREMELDIIKTVRIIGTTPKEQVCNGIKETVIQYSFLIEYTNGKREVIECAKGSEQFNGLIAIVDFEDK